MRLVLKKKVLFFTILAATLLSSIPFDTVTAYNTLGISWPKSIGVAAEVKLRYEISGKTKYNTAFDTAVADWNAAQSKIKFNLSPSNTLSPNVVGTFGDYDQSLYGRCNYSFNSNNKFISIQARLNAFNNNIDTNATVRRSTAGHELGHGLGLDHTSVVVIAYLMSSNRDRTSIYTPKSDDINGVNAIYPF
ncbi:matrixin family metalloprotease [Paenibacillus sp. SYP-B4298]|uniref:matrixin family metalloprotease n=1 Tax=Paenibacillus sp. SYP-B4298 TaxID=2996034 RepID=UPI0022DDF592|nr:M57 family metalloprotease [Paenibacillus sp. SYP-B4298]